MRALAAAMVMMMAPHSHAKHGNPDDLAGYIAKMEDPSRDAWQKPDEVLRALAVAKSATACDVGAGPGYFSLRLARAVGDAGRVFAVDVEPRILDVLRERIARAGARNVTPVLALPDDPLLPDGACDLILIIDTFHHFPDGAAYLARLQRALKPGGRVVNIDFHKRELPVGPPPEHKVAREEFLTLAERAGFVVDHEPTFLPYQYFLILKPKR
jgi:ubiquinone/menaquinone biosynthesis C-methylase UbiE